MSIKFAALITLIVCLSSWGCQNRSSQAVATQAPRPMVSMAVLDRCDPASGPIPAQPGAVVPLPSDYELVWQAVDESGNGHWVMRQMTTGSPGGGIRLRTGEAGPNDVEPLQPAYIDQEMARLLVSMHEVNRKQAEQLVEIVGAMHQLREQADQSARNTMYLATQLAQKELELRKLQAAVQSQQEAGKSKQTSKN